MIVVLAFDLQPDFPPTVAIGIMLATTAVYFIPRWSANAAWDSWHTCCLLFGTMLGAMLSGFVGFIGAEPKDLYFKIITKLIAIVLLIKLLVNVRRNKIMSKRS